jgi:hypothetical protein
MTFSVIERSGKRWRARQRAAHATPFLADYTREGIGLRRLTADGLLTRIFRSGFSGLQAILHSPPHELESSSSVSARLPCFFFRCFFLVGSSLNRILVFTRTRLARGDCENVIEKSNYPISGTFLSGLNCGEEERKRFRDYAERSTQRIRFSSSSDSLFLSSSAFFHLPTELDHAQN